MWTFIPDNRNHAILWYFITPAPYWLTRNPFQWKVKRLSIKTIIASWFAAFLLLSLSPQSVRATERVAYLHCAAQEGTPNNDLEQACAALAQELGKTRTVSRINTDSFGGQEGLHIRLTIAIKNRHSLKVKLDWQSIVDGRINQEYTGRELMIHSSDQQLNIGSFALMARSLAKNSNLPE